MWIYSVNSTRDVSTGSGDASRDRVHDAMWTQRQARHSFGCDHGLITGHWQGQAGLGEHRVRAICDGRSSSRVQLDGGVPQSAEAGQSGIADPRYRAIS
jgi:hypothetical protein